MTAFLQVHAHDGVTGIEQGIEHGQIGIGTGMRLYIGMLGTEELAGALPGNLLHLVHFLAEEDVLKSLTENGQIATQYVDLDGRATLDIHFNPNGSLLAVEGITSPDGRVLGKMGHSERIGKGLYKNVPGNTDMQLFRAGLEYFTTVK